MNNNDQTKTKRRFSLSLKLNLTSVLILLAFLFGVLFISYHVQKNRIQEEYYNVANKAVFQLSNDSSSRLLSDLRKYIDSEEFALIREKAVESNNPSIISEWMKGQELEFTLFDGESSGYTVTLLELYDIIGMTCSNILQQYDITSAYHVYMKDGKAYYLAYPPKGLLHLGTEAPDIVLDNTTPSNHNLIPAQIYRDPNETICRAISLLHNKYYDEEKGEFTDIVEADDAEQFGLAIVDIKMEYIMNSTRSFILNILLFTLLLTAACIAINIFLVRRIAAKPLKELTKATCSFGNSEDGYSLENVANVDIRSNDEINDLYQEIRAMQTRIVNYTDDLTRLTAEKARASTELQLAANIQNSMLKDSSTAFTDRNDFQIAASMNPAKEVGGDFYDFFLVDENHLALVIADVSGKGIPAALFMMSAMLLIKSRTESASPGEVLRAVNNEICQNNKAEMFVTVWMGILDLKTGIIRCANAGHENPTIRDNSGEFKIFKDPHGLVIGTMSGIKYKEYELKLESGDILFVYTDGLPEAGNTSNEFYGTERMVNTLNASGADDPTSVLEAMTRDVTEFVGEAEQFDDLTMLCVKYQ